MSEFRTTPENGPQQKDSDSDEVTFQDFLDQAAKNLKNNQDAQVVLAQALEDNGIDPRYLSVFSPSMAKLMRQAQEQAQAQAQSESQGRTVPSPDPSEAQKTDQQKQEEIDTMTEESEVLETEVAKANNITTEDLLKFIEELSGVLPKGEDTTLADLYELGKANPDIVQNAIDTRLN